MPRISKSKDAGQPLSTYGFPLAEGYTQLQYDRAAFAQRRSVDQGAPRRIDLFKRISDRLLPAHFEWHDWTENCISSLCNHSVSAFPGCSGSAKTFNVTGFAVAWWLADPDASSVMLISTTKSALRQRAWSEVTKCHTSIPGPRIGNFIDSRMMWQARKGDDRHAIFGKAVEEGPIHKVTDNIKGVHTRRQMVVIDEATAVPAAIYQALGNMFSYPEEFVVVFIGNPLNRFDQFGRVCEPAEGWPSVNVETDSWEGKPLDELGGKRCHVVRFDAEKSPNIVLGKLVSKHLPTKEIVEKAREKSGGGNTPLYWQNQRGFWPPEGLTKTVFTQSIIDKHDATGKFTFTGKQFKLIGMCDPAFGGGDRPVLQFAKMGEVEDGAEFRIAIEALPPIVIPLNAHLKNQPINYQLSDFIKNAASNINVNGVSYECLPENFGLDAGGAGGGLADILEREWSPRIIRIDFGGAASEDAASLEDSRPACEVYQAKNCEMQFRARDAVQAGQMKGLNSIAAEELCNRSFIDLSADGTSKKRISLQPKKLYKLEFKKSPDYGDAWVGLIEVARKRGFRLTAQGQTAVVATDFSKDVKASLEVYEHTFQEEEINESVEALC